MTSAPWIQPGLFFAIPSERPDAKVAIFGAPFDGTSSNHPGSRFGPARLRAVSDALEDYSPYQDREVDEVAAIDLGDLQLPYGDTPRALREIKHAVEGMMQRDLIPMMLGGEHLCTLPVIEALSSKYPDLVVLQLDAHTDLRDEYIGETLSHATVMKRILDLFQDPQRIISYGLRSGLKHEFVLARQCRFCGPFPGSPQERLKALQEHLKEIIAQKTPVYITLDLDVFDPAIMPGTGTPEPGGIFLDEFWQMLPIFKQLNLVGCDIVEYCPISDPTQISALLASKVVREMLLLFDR